MAILLKCRWFSQLQGRRHLDSFERNTLRLHWVMLRNRSFRNTFDFYTFILFIKLYLSWYKFCVLLYLNYFPCSLFLHSTYSQKNDSKASNSKKCYILYSPLLDLQFGTIHDHGILNWNIIHISKYMSGLD